VIAPLQNLPQEHSTTATSDSAQVKRSIEHQQVQNQLIRMLNKLRQLMTFELKLLFSGS
jgi:hypothetical protein